jgi:hypothetical protein
MNSIRLLAFAAAVSCAAPALAHPGHGDPSAPAWLHGLAEPEHFFVLAALALSGAAAASFLSVRRRRDVRRPARR